MKEDSKSYKAGDLCPTCTTKMEARPNMFHWRGEYFSGIVCTPCNALYDNKNNSFKDHVFKSK